MCLAVLAVLTGHAAAAEDRVEPPGAGESEALRGNVLVWADATFYTEPSTTAPSLHAGKLAAERKASPGAAVPMHVVSVTKDGFVEVEPASELDCASSRFETTEDLQRVRLFVRRADIAPVLVEPYTKTFPDGTRIALKPGVAVVPTASGKYVLGVRGGEVVVELPQAAVGHAYAPDHSKVVTAITDREYQLAPKTHVTLGDQGLVLTGPRSRAQSVERRGDSTLFSIQTRCIALDVIAPSRSVRAVDDDDSEDGTDGGSGIGVLELRDHDYIPPGTLLSTPGGRQIAVAAKPMFLVGPPHGKTACVERRVRIGGDGVSDADDDDRLRVCAPASKVFHDKLNRR